MDKLEYLYKSAKDQYLTDEKRKKYLAELNEKQKQTLEEFKRYRFNSNILTKINQEGVHWRLEYELINYSFDFHQPQNSYLKCDCGRPVKYLYMCRGDNGEEKGFGINHLQQEAGIPLEVIRQINKIHHEIDRGTDTIISLYHEGVRFPVDDYTLAKEKHLLPTLDPKQNAMFENFKKVNLPLYYDDYQIIADSVKTYHEQEQVKRECEEQRKREEREKQAHDEWIAYQEQQRKLAEQRRQKAEQERKEREKEFERQMKLAEEERKKKYQKQVQLLKDIDANWKRVFTGCEYIIKENFFKYYHFRIACYIMFNNGQAQVGDIIHTPEETRQLETKFLKENNHIHTELMLKDPYLIEFLACLKDGRNLLNAFLKHGIIKQNERGQYIYIGVTDENAQKGQTSLF